MTNPNPNPSTNPIDTSSSVADSLDALLAAATKAAEIERAREKEMQEETLRVLTVGANALIRIAAAMEEANKPRDLTAGLT